MRIEEYKREIGENGYRVIGSSWDYNQHDNRDCSPIHMWLTDTYGFPPIQLEHPICDNLDELIDIAQLGVSPEEDEEYIDFCKNYKEIVRGNCPYWQLGEFEVFVGGVLLGFGNAVTADTGWLYITGAKELRLSFKTSRTQFGFVPVYYVHIKHDSKGKHCFTKVTEDLGYIRREISFKLKDPTKRSDNIFHRGNQYLEVTEYAGI